MRPPPAADDGRGRGAERPSEIPRPGWRDVLWRVWEQIGKDNVSMAAAGVAFYSLLAIFPAITAFVSLYGWSPIRARSSSRSSCSRA